MTALVLGAAAAGSADSGGTSVALVVALLALVGSVVAALFGFFGKRGEVAVSASGQLSTSQLAFIAEVRKDNAELRERVDRLESREGKLVDRVSTLEGLLRQNGIPVPPPLRFDVAG